MMLRPDDLVPALTGELYRYRLAAQDQVLTLVVTFPRYVVVAPTEPKVTRSA
jgi:hypothetical protein